MAKKNQTLAEMDKEISQLNTRRDDLLRMQKEAQREQSTRQKIIIGAWVLTNDLALFEKVKAGLTRDQDRIAFGLPPLDVKKTPTNAESGVLESVSVTH